MTYDKHRLDTTVFFAEEAYKSGSAWDGDRDYTVDFANATKGFPDLIEKVFRAIYSRYAAFNYYPEENNWPKGLPKTDEIKGYDTKYLEDLRKEREDD